MAGIGDIQPPQPVYPKRPMDRPEKERDQNEREKNPPRPRQDVDDDGKPHVDEFA